MLTVWPLALNAQLPEEKAIKKNFGILLLVKLHIRSTILGIGRSRANLLMENIV